MNLTDILLGVLIIGGAYYLYTRNSAVRDLLTLGHDHGDPIPPQYQKGTTVNNFNPAEDQIFSLGPADTKTIDCPKGYVKAWGMNEGIKMTYCHTLPLPPGLHALSTRMRISLS